MGHPDFSKDAYPFVVCVDSSKHGVGATLSQKQWDEDILQEKVIYYTSKAIGPDHPARFYSAYKLELFGLVTAIEQFKYYLYGRPFVVKTDHRSLEWLKTSRNPRMPAQMLRWQSYLDAEYNFRIQYCPAGQMKIADCLSRRPESRVNDNLLPNYPYNTVKWDSDPPREQAAQEMSDDFWISTLTKKHGVKAKPLVVNAVTRQSVVKFRKLSTRAREPKKGSEDAAGYDLYAAEELEIPPGKEKVVKTDIQISLPPNTYGRIASRSGLSIKHSVEVGAGVIDRDYRGNIGVVLRNHSRRPFVVGLGDRIAQLIVEKNDPVVMEEVDELEVTKRGQSGFGSTGMNDQPDGLASSTRAQTGEPDGLASSTRAQIGIGEEDEVQLASSTRAQIGEDVDDIIPENDFPTGGEATPPTLEDLDPLEENFSPAFSQISKFILEKRNKKRMDFNTWLNEEQDKDEVLRLAKKALRDRDDKYFFNDPKQVRNHLRRVCKDNADRETEQLNAARAIKQYLKQGKLFLDPDSQVLRIKNKHHGPYCIPLDQRQVMIRSVHHSSGTFHLGIQRTAAVVQNYFYWPNLAQDCREFINKCDVCIKAKRLKSRSGPGLKKTSSVPLERLAVWSTDVIAMPKGHGNANCIVTFQDCATGWLEAWSAGSAKARVIAKLVQRMCNRYGEGLTFVTDQGKEFMAQEVKDVMMENGGAHYVTTSHHSNSNPVERAHRDLGALIRLLIEDKHLQPQQWPLVLDEALRTMRFSPDSLTQQSAFIRTFGKKPLTRIDTWIGNGETTCPWAPEEPEPMFKLVGVSDGKRVFTRPQDDGKVATRQFTTRRPQNPEQDEHLLATNAVTVQDRAQRRRDVANQRRHEQNREYFNKKYQPVYYSPVVGELVDWKAPVDEKMEGSRKTAVLWRGPYRVVDIHQQNPNSVIIRRLDPRTLNDKVDKFRRKIERRVYAGDLRPSTCVLRREDPHKPELPPWVRDHAEHADEPSSGIQGQGTHGNSDDNTSELSFEVVSENDSACEEPRVTRQRVTQQ